MADQTQMSPAAFQEQLGKVLQYAQQHGNRITKEEVSGFFRGAGLTEEQLQMVCGFLMSRKVIVPDAGPGLGDAGNRQGADAESGMPDADARKAAQRALRPEEHRWLEKYREELQALNPEGEGEWEALLLRLRMQEAKAVERLAEILLPDILEEALRLPAEHVLLQDLVQEGSLQVLLAGADTDWRMITSARQGREKMLRAAAGAMQALLAEQDEVHVRDRKMVEKAENLKDGIEVLKEEMGRRVYLDEVADFLSMTEEEAEDILRLTGERPSEESE